MTGRIHILRAGATVVSINPLPNSAYTRSVMGEEAVTLSWEQPTYTELKVGDYLVYDAISFTLNQLPTVKKLAANNYRYDASFQSAVYELLKATYLLFDGTGTIPQGDFSLTGEPQAFLNLLVQNMNRIGTGWAVGSVVTGEAKTLAFSNESCFAALSRLAQEYETEFSVSGKTIHLNKITRVANLTLEYGSTLYDIERKTVDSTDIITRLYPFGSTRNLQADYRGGSQRLLLPSPFQYVESNVDKYGIIEGTKTFEDIYPRIKAGTGLPGTVTSVGDINTLTDQNLDFDINACLLPRTPAKVKFISGACAGYECEIKQYSNSTKTLVIIPNEDDKGWQIPQANIKPAAGDNYVLLDIAMPAQYVTAAELELQTKAVQYLAENSQPKVSYSVTISSLYAVQNAVDIRPGDLVQVVDAPLGVNIQLRVVKVTSEVRENYNIKIDLADTISKATLQRIADELEDNKAGVAAVSKGVSQAFARSWRDVQELAGMIDTLRTDMLIVGNVQGQFSIKSTLFTPNYSNNKNQFYATPGQLVHTAVPSEAAPGTWAMPAYAPTLASDTTPYYLYAKCSRTVATGVYHFSETAIPFDSDPTDWYFLVGVISSVNGDIRSFQTAYGFTQITGRQVVTGTIQSADGSAYFNLDTGEIGGSIKFVSTGGGLTDMAEWAENTSSDIDDVRNKRALRIEKFATPGYDTFRENVPYSATLALKIFLDDIDETASMDIGRFVWMRLSENTAGDPGWNERHSNAGASIDITSEDLAGDTSFIVQFYDVENAVRYTTTF